MDDIYKIFLPKHPRKMFWMSNAYHKSKIMETRKIIVNSEYDITFRYYAEQVPGIFIACVDRFRDKMMIRNSRLISY